MAYYNVIVKETVGEGADQFVTLGLAFGEPAQNDKIVPDAVAAVAALGLKGGKGVTEEEILRAEAVSPVLCNRRLQLRQAPRSVRESAPSILARYRLAPCA